MWTKRWSVQVRRTSCTSALRNGYDVSPADAGCSSRGTTPRWRVVSDVPAQPSLAGRTRRTRPTHNRGNTYNAAGHWQRLVDRTRDFDGSVVFSNELLSAPRTDVRPTALRGLDSYDTHLVLTARDPGRQPPSCWQQGLRHGATTTFRDYVASLNPDGTSTVGRWFQGQRFDRPLDLWGAHLPADHIHIVVVPPRGAKPSLLWSRLCSLLDVDAERYPTRYAPTPASALRRSSCCNA